MVSLAFLLSILFLILVPLRVSLSTSMMKFCSAPERKSSETPASLYSCIYCKKVFPNHRALGGHLKTHNAEIKSPWRRNPPGNCGNSTGFTGNTSNPPSNNQPGNCLIPTRSCSIKTIPVHASALQYCQHILSKPSFTFSTITNPYPFLSSNQSPGSNETVFAGLSFIDPCPCSCQDEDCPCKMKGSLAHEEGERMYPEDALRNMDVTKALKRPKIASNLPVEIEKSQNKELSLVKDLEKPFSGLGISFDAKQEDSADIDLSLHL